VQRALDVGGFVYIHYTVPPHFVGIAIIASVDGRFVKLPVLLFRHLAQLKTIPKSSL